MRIAAAPAIPPVKPVNLSTAIRATDNSARAIPIPVKPLPISPQERAPISVKAGTIDLIACAIMRIAAAPRIDLLCPANLSRRTVTPVNSPRRIVMAPTLFAMFSSFILPIGTIAEAIIFIDVAKDNKATLVLALTLILFKSLEAKTRSAMHAVIPAMPLAMDSTSISPTVFITPERILIASAIAMRTAAVLRLPSDIFAFCVNLANPDIKTLTEMSPFAMPSISMPAMITMAFANFLIAIAIKTIDADALMIDAVSVPDKDFATRPTARLSSANNIPIDTRPCVS